MRPPRLRHEAQVNPPTPEFEHAPGYADVTFVPLEGVWTQGVDVSRTRPKDLVAQGYTRFRDGDIVVPKITPTFQADRSTMARGLMNGFAAGTTELHVIRPGPGIDGRYIAYLVSSRPFLLGGEAEMIGVAGQKRVPDDWIRDFRVSVTAVGQQRAIADFLDTETARIDALITKKRRMIGMLEERARSEIDRAVGIVVDWSNAGVPRPRDQGTTIARLGVVCQIQSGLTLDAAREVDSEVQPFPYLRVANVQDGALSLHEVKEVRVPRHLAARTMLRSGDVLMTEGGDPDKLGRGAVWPGDISPCLHQNHVFAVRPGPSIRPDYLALLTRSSYARAYFEVTASKTTGIASTSTTKIASFRVPLPPPETQAKVVARWQTTNANVTTAIDTLTSQNALLREHRQALITAAVTGELEIPGVAA